MLGTVIPIVGIESRPRCLIIYRRRDTIWRRAVGVVSTVLRGIVATLVLVALIVVHLVTLMMLLIIVVSPFPTLADPSSPVHWLCTSLPSFARDASVSNEIRSA